MEEPVERKVPFKGNFSSATGEEIPVPEPVAEPVVQPDPEPKAEPVAVPAKEEPKQSAPDQNPVIITDWKKISELAGEEVLTDEQLAATFKSRRDLTQRVTDLESKAKNYDALDPLALDIDRAKKSGLDLDLYLEARKMDPDKITDSKEVLRQKYYREYPEYDRKLANTLFEDEYETKYGILDQKFNEIEQEENQKKIDLAKARLEAETIRGKKYLTDWKAKNVTITEPTPQYSEEKNREARDSYMNTAKEFVDNLGELEVSVGDKVFKYGVEDRLKDISADIQNPLETLKRFGVDIVGQSIDAEKFGEIITKLYALENIGKPLADWVLEQSNAQHVKTKLDAPAPAQPPAAGDPAEKDHATKVAEALEADRQRRRQGIR